MTALSPIDILEVRNILGEGILWDSRRRLLWWTDIQGRQLHRYDWAGRTLDCIATPDRVASFGLVADSEKFITAFACGVALYDPGAQTLEWLESSAPLAPGVRFNDGRVDRHGRFWAGTMVEDRRRGTEGCLYSIDAGEIRCRIRGISISNSLCMSPDGNLLYFADSPTRTIWRYELSALDGALSAPRVFAQTPEGIFPDGATVDVDGCVWSAHWRGSCVVRYTPDGRIDRTISLPTCQPTCVCFAGPDLDVLCVTSAREHLDSLTLDAEPHAGAVFLYRPGVQGLPESEYCA